MSQSIIQPAEEFSTFLSREGFDRKTIIDAILWCIGAITVKSRVIE